MLSEKEGLEVSDLSELCGHHCGVVTTGKAKHVGHCDCPECHGNSEEEVITMYAGDLPVASFKCNPNELG